MNSLLKQMVKEGVLIEKARSEVFEKVYKARALKNGKEGEKK